MGIFDFFRKSSEPASKSTAEDKSEANVKPIGNMGLSSSTSEEDHRIHAQIFLKEMSTIEAFSETEVREMLKIIQSTAGGHRDQSGYFSRLYDEYFEHREWRWPWYEMWDAKFKVFGSYPPRWPYCGREREAPSQESIIEMLNVAQLREALAAAGVELQEKMLKKDLLMLAKTDEVIKTAVASCPAGLERMESYRQRPRHDLYLVLMRTISFWSSSAYKKQRSSSLGLDQGEWIFQGEDCIPYAELALAENRDALSPLYPGDISYRKTKFPY